MQLNYWEQSTFFSGIDVAIIGSGIVGLTTAIHLKMRQPNLKVVVLEKGAIPSGASTRNAGFACFGSISELTDDMENIGIGKVLQLVAMRQKGLQKLRSLVSDEALDFKMHGGYELFLKEENYEEYADNIDFFNKELRENFDGQDVFENMDSAIDSFGFDKVKRIILNKGEGQLHTGKMMSALLDLARKYDIEIFNGIEIKKIHNTGNQVTLETNTGWGIKANKVVVAVNGFARKLLPNIEVQPARNQVLMTEPIINLPFKGTFHYDSGYYYFRNVGHRVLLGGGRNLNPKGEETDEFGQTEEIQQRLIEILQTVILPQHSYRVEYQWSGILGVGTDKMPIVKMLDDKTGIAVKMGGMGVAIGSLIGSQAAEMVLS